MTTIDATTYSFSTRVFGSASASTSTSKVPKNTTSSAAYMSTYVANGVFISTLTSVTASKSTSASTSVSPTVSTSVLTFASNYETSGNANVSSVNFPVSVSGTASFLTQTNALLSKSTSTAANLLTNVSPAVLPYNANSLTLTSGAPNDRFLGNICSEPSTMAKIFESPRTAKNFEN